MEKQAEHNRANGSEMILYNTVMVDTCHYTFVKTQSMYDTKSKP